MGFDLDLEEIQSHVLNEARERIHETVSDFEILTNRTPTLRWQNKLDRLFN